MYNTLKPYLYLLFIILVASCKSGGRESQTETKEVEPVARGSFSTNIGAMVELQTLDHYTRVVNRGHGFYVAPNIIVTNLDIIQGAYRVRFAPTGTRQFSRVDGYTAYSLDNNLVLLNVQRNNNNYLNPVDAIAPTDTLYTLLRPKNQLMIQKSAVEGIQTNDSSDYYLLRAGLDNGKPAFYADHRLAGIIQTITHDNEEEQNAVLHSKWIKSLLLNQHASQPVFDLSRKSNQIYPSHTTIKGFRIVTDMGNIEIKLYDETPKYRDNFIRLVTDQYYDSLLIHRVLRGFLIQTGAADTRDATPEDVVGWQGPGYTIPMKIVPGLYHKRGAIASSKLPHARNPRDESDGSQFYIVAGRRFSDIELDDLEIQTGIKFSAEQRHTYRTIGGAPHLDNHYTVFGEVTSGLDVVDKISLVRTKRDDRPEDDIWMRTIEIIFR